MCSVARKGNSSPILLPMTAGYTTKPATTLSRICSSASAQRNDSGRLIRLIALSSSDLSSHCEESFRSQQYTLRITKKLEDMSWKRGEVDNPTTCLTILVTVWKGERIAKKTYRWPTRREEDSGAFDLDCRGARIAVRRFESATAFQDDYRARRYV